MWTVRSEVAREVLAGTSSAQWFRQVSRDSVARLSRLDPGRPIQVQGRRPMTLADWVTTRVMSVAAHGLDVALTLGLPPWTTRSALDVTRPVLISLLGTELPAELAGTTRPCSPPAPAAAP